MLIMILKPSKWVCKNPLQDSIVELVLFFDAAKLFEHNAYVVLMSDTKRISNKWWYSLCTIVT